MNPPSSRTIAVQVLAAFTVLAGSSMLLQQTMFAATSANPAFSFRNTDYFHRWSQNTQHEFTPAKQEDLAAWTDMITINLYPDAKDGDAVSASLRENGPAAEKALMEWNSIAAAVGARL